jgi:hypothetical protein
MIIAGHALLALLSLPQETQGLREDEGSFGALLTEVGKHVTSLSDQEETERRALESVLQVLLTLFQSCTPANLLPGGCVSGTGESDCMSMRPAGGLPLDLAPGRSTAPALWATGEVNLPSGMVSDGTQDIGQLAVPELDGQKESTPNLSGLFMVQPAAALSVPTPMTDLGPLSGAPLPAATPSFSRDGSPATAEAQYGSPGLLQNAHATAGERPEAVLATLSPPLSRLSAHTSMSDPDAWNGLSGPVPPLAPGEARGELASQTVSTERSTDTGAAAYRVFSHMVFATPGQGDGLTSDTCGG